MFLQGNNSATRIGRKHCIYTTCLNTAKCVRAGAKEEFLMNYQGNHISQKWVIEDVRRRENFR